MGHETLEGQETLGLQKVGMSDWFGLRPRMLPTDCYALNVPDTSLTRPAHLSALRYVARYQYAAHRQKQRKKV